MNSFVHKVEHNDPSLEGGKRSTSAISVIVCVGVCVCFGAGIGVTSSR